MTEKQRFRVVIRCPECGEKYILRGSKSQDGKFETGFIRCICGNAEKFDIDTTPE